MQSLILQTAARFLLPLMLLFSIMLLLVGHDKSGGGFIGGLMAAAAIALAQLSFDPSVARRILPVSPQQLLGLGLLIAAASGTWSMLFGEPFLAASWGDIPPLLPGGNAIHIGTPLVFDVGVYLTVLGSALTMLLTLAEGVRQS